MEENVALDPSKQKKFNKSIKNLIKKNNAGAKTGSDSAKKFRSGRITKKKRKQRGLVYLGHIPHGFYEHEMTQYFKQFGVVTNARVIKSKRTGRSKGYAFVEFKDPTVAQIVAETMNNYLMGKRLIKASYIPPEKQRKAFRKHWNTVNNPGNEMRIKSKKAYNANRDEKEELQRANKLLKNINYTKQKLKELGIDYDFFTPVDVPQQLLDKVPIKEEDIPRQGKISVKKEDNKKELIGNAKPKNKEAEIKPLMKIKKYKMTNEIKWDDNMQKQKNDKLKGKGVQLLEEFIKVKPESDNESDNSEEFDSDEFEKMMQNEEEDVSDESDAGKTESDGLDEDESQAESDDGESDGADDDASQSESDGGESESDGIDEDASQSDSAESVEELPAKKKKLPLPKAVPQVLPKNSVVVGKQTQKKKQQHHQVKKPLQQYYVAAAKKQKFEKKSSQKHRNKQFKK